jgi:hypothetical protein
MASTFASTPIAGVALSFRDTTPSFAVGTPVLGNKNDTWVYVYATEGVTGTCTVDASFNVTDTAGNYTSPAAFTTGQYGWVYKTTSPL